MIRSLVILAATAWALSTALPAWAQAEEATIYRDTNFRGPAVAVSRPNPNMQLNFQVFSLRVSRTPWELCSQPNFRGTCITIRQSTADLRRSYNWPGPLQSMRPADGGWGGGGGGGPTPQQSLRGMASEFFPAPREGRGSSAQRVLACTGAGNSTANCAAQTADRFCRSNGWAGSARELMETVNRRVYLADVLCVRSGY
ncbi:beta/gamma crystallin-related protein [Sandaracinobacteroides hominis]|uniref:beta/gamma crystallin-related protein n=1 Tax=Sandaracinobacteroides hominis TaxID=2780086 RepID=UPI0018F39ECA|nr:beta/gamma crystallin-related protein [Sandaracinobacteroides hominis]